MAAADAALAAELGVAPSVVETLRRGMTLGEHWTRDATGRVAFTDVGTSMLREQLAVFVAEKKEGAPISAGASDDAAAVVLPSRAFTIWMREVEEPGEPVLVVIVRCHPNPHFVRVRTPDGGLTDVKVRNNQVLRVRVKIRCRLLPDGRWECCHHGQNVRLPEIKKEPAAVG